MKRILSFALVALSLSLSAQEAPENYVAYPYAFIGLQGGAQTTFTNFNNWKLITPTASISGGVQFTPVFGARLHFNGIWNKGGVCQDDVCGKYKYKYLTTDLDAMINVLNIFRKEKYNPLNVYLIGGVGLNYAWGYHKPTELMPYLALADTRNRLSHNFRIGGMIDYQVAKHWTVNLEVSGNSLSDRYNSKFSGSDDWQLTAQLGVAYKIGIKKKAKPTIVPEPKIEYETRKDTIWDVREKSIPYDSTVVTQKYANGEGKWEVFYGLRESGFNAEKQLKDIGAFLQKNKDCKVEVSSYADKGTGNPKLNLGYSKQRAEKAVKALIDAGVPKQSITSSYYGDKVQPYAENDKNRLTIIKATGLQPVEEKSTVKAYRIEKERYIKEIKEVQVPKTK